MQKQKLQQKLGLNLSPQQIQFLSLLQIPVYALNSRIQEELEENPALEESESTAVSEDTEDTVSIDKSENENRQFSSKQSSYEGLNNYNQNLRAEENIQEYLKKQLLLLDLNDEKRFLTEYLIDSLDDNGWINREINSVVDDLKINLNLDFSETEIQEALFIVQTLDPCGVGARNLKECLIIQLKNKKQNSIIQLAVDILQNEYDRFIKKNFESIIKKLEISENDLKSVYSIIEKLNPFPASNFSKSVSSEYITPDFLMSIEGDEYIVRLAKRSGKDLRISPHYQNMMNETIDSEAKEFLKQKIEQAKWFSEAIIKREQTLLKVMNTIISIQKNYFKSGDEKDLKPMKLDDVAVIVGMDRSTVSRVTNSKSVETFFGVISLKNLFSQAYFKDNGEVVSTKKIKKHLEEIIQTENKKMPYTDDQISDLLGKDEYHIARRTVAKYRESLGILTSKYRREL